MNITTSPVGISINQKQQDYLDTKLKRVAYAEDLIVDLIVKIKHDNEFSVEATVNFRWGAQAHVSAQDEDYQAAVNKMMDVLDNKVKKEKDKIQGK